MADTLGRILEWSVRYFWPTFWSLLTSLGILRLFEWMPIEFRVMMILGAVAGIFVASDTWEEEACNCDDEDCKK